MATDTQSKPSPPELTVLHRVQCIPVLKDSLAYAHTTLSNNAYTHAAYNAAQAFSLSAYQVSEPIQVRFAPIIVRADGLANKGLDAVQSRYPYPFEAQTDDVLSTLKAQSEAYQNIFDTRVKGPAFGFAEKVDSQFTPIVDRLEFALQKLQSQENASDSASSSSESSSASTSQLSRAYRLSLDIKDQIYTLSTEQVKQLRAQNAIVQRAVETIESLNTTLIATYSSAQEKGVSFGKDTSAKVQEVSHNLQHELEKLQAATKQLPGQLQPFRDALTGTISDLSQIVQAPGVPVSEKVTKIRVAVQEKVAPALKALRGVLEERGLLSKPKEEQSQGEAANGEATQGSTEETTEESAPQPAGEAEPALTEETEKPAETTEQ